MLKVIMVALIPLLTAIALADPSSNEEKAATIGPIFERTIYLGVPASKVWEALTLPEIVNQYYLVPLGKLELKKGGEIYYGSAKEKVITGTVTEFQTGQTLIHTFKFTHQPQDPESRVTYQIRAMGPISALNLRHDHFPSTTATYHDIAGGWETILSSLKTLLETGKPLPWSKVKDVG